MSNARPFLPSVESPEESRELIASLYGTITLYGRVLWKVLPALEGNRELRDIVRETLEP
jgi:hypothetical protein